MQWNSRLIFKLQPSEIEQLFRKKETKFKLLITKNMHQEFNNIYIHAHTHIYIVIYILK